MGRRSNGPRRDQFYLWHRRRRVSGRIRLLYQRLNWILGDRVIDSLRRRVDERLVQLRERLCVGQGLLFGSPRDLLEARHRPLHLLLRLFVFQFWHLMHLDFFIALLDPLEESWRQLALRPANVMSLPFLKVRRNLVMKLAVLRLHGVSQPDLDYRVVLLLLQK